MEAYYILIVGVLFLLAISDLVVGVSNDAVNFLNSALGSRAASFRLILVIASAGVLVGAVFSNGMMEVARKGIFNPEQFAFTHIMIIFLAVMLTDILLLDFFNTMGLPTSTTVSIVFELLGAAVAVSIFKLASAGEPLSNLGDHINTERAVVIITGIFLSVIIAFSMGMIIQGIIRLAFSFNLGKTNRIWGGIWGGFAITVILYFLLMKGAEGSTLVSEEMLSYINAHTVRILLLSLIGFTFLFQFLVFFTRINVLRIIVLVGTFALAMAFAGNDLVNFIGVPLAGFESFKNYMASGIGNPDGLMMEALRQPVDTPIFFLIAAGIVMVLTLRFSKKARTVTETEINLGRQGEGTERFTSSLLARFIVRRSVEFTNGMSYIIPRKVSGFVSKRFKEDGAQAKKNKKDKAAFDLVRASVNLVVSSILISFATSLKLPLSTTYVTFMVAMGTSLADGAWGRESAVYRITGVLTVIGGWFFTAFSAFSAAFLIATLIFFGKLPVILALIAVSVLIILRTHAFHRKKSEKARKFESELIDQSFSVLRSCEEEVRNSVVRVSKILYLTYNSFLREKMKEMKRLNRECRQLNREVKEIRDSIPVTLRTFKETEIESGHHYVMVVDHLKEMTNSLAHILRPAYDHLDNNHPIDGEQTEVLGEFNEATGEFFNFVLNLLRNRNSEKLAELNRYRDEMIGMINEIIRNRIKILKKTQKGVKVSVTYLEMLSETKNLFLHVVQLVKADHNLHQSFSPGVTYPEEKVLD